MPIEEDESTSYITELHENDVLFGRSACSDRFEGNIRFRKAIRDRSEEYRAVRKSEDKSRIAMEIVHLVEGQNGRFLRKTQLPTAQPKTFYAESNEPVAWMTVEATIVLDKIKQALRDATGKDCKRRQTLEHVNFEAVAESPTYSTSSDVVDSQTNTSHAPHDQRRKYLRCEEVNKMRLNVAEKDCWESTKPATTDELEILRQTKNVVPIQQEQRQFPIWQNPSESYYQDKVQVNCRHNSLTSVLPPTTPQAPPVLPWADDPASLLQIVMSQHAHRQDVLRFTSRKAELSESQLFPSNCTLLPVVGSKGEYSDGQSQAIEIASSKVGILHGYSPQSNPNIECHVPLLLNQREHEKKANEGISSNASSANLPFQPQESSQRLYEHKQGDRNVVSERLPFSMWRSDQTTLLRADDTDEYQNRDEVQNKEGHGQFCIRAIRAAQTFQTFQLNESTRSLVASSWQIIPETYLGILLTLNTPFTIDDLQILALTWTWAVSFHASSCLEQVRIVIESLLQMESSRLHIGQHVVRGIHNALYGEITPLSNDEQLFIRVTL